MKKLRENFEETKKISKKCKFLKLWKFLIKRIKWNLELMSINQTSSKPTLNILIPSWTPDCTLKVQSPSYPFSIPRKCYTFLVILKPSYRRFTRRPRDEKNMRDAKRVYRLFCIFYAASRDDFLVSRISNRLVVEAVIMHETKKFSHTIKDKIIVWENNRIAKRL